MSVEQPETKKPTCVGFFIEQNLLNALLQVPQQVRQPVPMREPQRPVLERQPVQVRRQEPGQQQERALQTCYRRLRTGLTMRQPEQNISFTFPPNILMTTRNNQKIESAAAYATTKAQHFINSPEKCQHFLVFSLL